jgi:type II secretory pathway component PulK
VRGFDAKAVETIRPYVTVLPVEPTGDQPRINANTADARVLAAACGIPAEKLSAFLAERAKKPFADKPALAARLQQDSCQPTNDPFDVKSAWFSVLVRVQQDDVLLGTEALVKREAATQGGATTVAWKRPRY